MVRDLDRCSVGTASNIDFWSLKNFNRVKNLTFPFKNGRGQQQD